MFDFGDNSTSVSTPFMKILSTYDPQTQGSAFANTRRTQLAQAPAANAEDILNILNGDPSYVLDDSPTASSTGGGGGNGHSSAAGMKSFSVEMIAMMAIGLIALSQLW